MCSQISATGNVPYGITLRVVFSKPGPSVVDSGEVNSCLELARTGFFSSATDRLNKICRKQTQVLLFDVLGVML